MINDRYNTSSYIATWQCAALFGLLSLGSLYAGFGVLGGFLLFVALLAICAYGWGRLALYGVSAAMKAQSCHAYPGQDMDVHFTLKNEKCLPLLWLEWVQPYPANGCLTAPEDFVVCDVTHPEAQTPIEPVLCRRFSFIHWYATVTWTSVFHAQCRGVYHPQTIDLHTGDGFGLRVEKGTFPLDTSPVFVVYPKRVAVSTQVFFKNAWSASTGPHGTIEDVTVLRGIRDYQPNDSFKRINWRLAARGGGLSVNVYDRISPRSVYFFVDTATFAGVEEDNRAFEETLSVVGSVIAELFAKDMAVGLYLPAASEESAFCVELEQSSLSDCLLALALCDCDNPAARFSQQSIADLLASQSGNVYYVCYDGQKGRFSALFEEVGITRFSVISHCEPDLDTPTGIDTSDISLYTIRDFQRGEL
ncbi:DUF58 domain-containing protein [Bengtsoniella intestinalis]|uniref:DUF58 domain-containing protein n=1 Tax=Bengtsoniella intestinalis TaxID=3073143 RepID=UPI00391F8147